MVALALVLSVLSWVLLAFFLMLVARFVLSLIVMFAPQWHPKGPLLLLFELIYSVTDPFLRPLRRILPPIGAGGVRIDLSMLMLFVLVSRGDVDQLDRDSRSLCSASTEPVHGSQRRRGEDAEPGRTTGKRRVAIAFSPARIPSEHNEAIT